MLVNLGGQGGLGQMNRGFRYRNPWANKIVLMIFVMYDID